MFLNNIDQIAQIEWGKLHYWDVMFTTATGYNLLPSPPPPFLTWFPAISVEENVATLSSLSIETYLSDTQIPHRSTGLTISLTFIDDDNHTLLQWFTNWINVEIFNHGFSVAPVQDIIRLLLFVKYKIVNGVKVPIGSPTGINVLNPLGSQYYGFKGYYVYPDTTLNYIGSSDAGLATYSIDFKIVGDTSKSAIPSKRSELVKQLVNGNIKSPPREAGNATGNGGSPRRS